MLRNSLIILLLLQSSAWGQNTKPLIATDNSTQTCNTTRMVFGVGSLTCSGSVATISGGGTNYWSQSGNSVYPATIGNNVGIGTSVPTSSLSLGAGTSSKAPLLFTAGTKLTSPLLGAMEYDGNYLYLTSFNDGGTNRFLFDLIPANQFINNANTFLGFGGNTTTTGIINAAVGGGLTELTSGGYNASVGAGALGGLTSGSYNTALGVTAFGNLIGNQGNNVAIGYNAGYYYKGNNNLSSLNNSTFIGYNTEAGANSDTNETVVGYDAVGNGSNSITLGGSGNNETVVPYGNVGIGSVSPGQLLDVNGTARMTGFNLSGGTNAYVLTSDASGNGTWQASSGGSSYWVTGNVGINTTNNVGIGSINPGQKLDVTGTVRMTGGIVGAAGITNTAGYTQSGSSTNAFTGTTNFGSSAQAVISNSGNVYTTGSCQFGGGTSSSSECAVYNGNMTIGATTGSAPSEGLYVTGNVGIGSAVASSNLYVAGTGIFQGDVSIGTNINSPAALSVMNGNVGIGTWVPSANLQVGKGAISAIGIFPGIYSVNASQSYVITNVPSNPSMYIGTDIYNNYGQVGTLNNFPVGIRADNNLVFTIYPSGQVNTNLVTVDDSGGNLSTSGVITPGDISTGGNLGTPVCTDCNGSLCSCGSCC